MQDASSLSPSSHSFSLSSSRPWPLIIGGSVAALLVIGAGTLFGIYQAWRGSKMIARGVSIAGVPVGGLTPSEAKAEVLKKHGRAFLTVKTPVRDYKLSVSQLGGTPQASYAALQAARFGREGSPLLGAWHYWTTSESTHRLALPIRWDKAAMKRTMWTVAKDYERAPRNARLTISDYGVGIMPDEIGRALNVGATLQTLQKKYYAGLPAIEATTREVLPRISAADLQGRDVLIGSYKTRFDAGLWGRTRNIRIAAAAVNGVVLMPGERLSFNALTGERTWEKGYRMAHIFERKPGAAEAEVVDGLAGGVCQVSSTLYNAVRKANEKINDGLRIVERSSHSLPVTYVPPGYDATVAWPYKDFKFRNTLSHPVYLRAQVAGSRLFISVWARVPGNTAIASVQEPAA